MSPLEPSDGKKQTKRKHAGAQAHDVEVKKKKKKSSQVLVEQADAGVVAINGISGLGSTGAADQNQQQPQKKKKKKKDKSGTADTLDTPGGHVDAKPVQPAGVELDGEAAADKPLTKKSKKSKKNKQLELNADNGTPAQPEQDSPPEETLKKPKKPKKSAAAAAAATAAGPAATRAEVGDHTLAASLPPIVKAIYRESAATAALTAAKVAELRAERGISVEPAAGGGAAGGWADLKPLLSFADTGLPPAMLHATRSFVQPSPIQSQCWPVILSGFDLVGVAATGSGKTLAFGLPALQHIAKQKEAGVVSGKGPFMLVMAPTRELAQQIAEVLTTAGEKCKCSCLCVYGGVPKAPQAQELKKGVDIVVGTPGRLEDLMNDGACRLKQVTYLVLDEADRMLDLGFEPHIRAIVGTVRSDRQTLMFSATWPTAVQKLAANFLCNPVKVTIGSHNLAASHSVTQVVEVMEPRARDERLLSLLKKHHKGQGHRIIVFVLYKKEAPRVEMLLQKSGFKAAAIHGDITQDKRNRAVEQFKAGTVPLLVATDVAARGLDIPDVEMVVNYSFPLTTEDYVHRIGRTGRAGKTGVAHTFFCGVNDKQRAGELINVLREAGQSVPEELLKFGTTVKKKESKLYGAHFKEVNINQKATKVTFDSDDDDS